MNLLFFLTPKQDVLYIYEDFTLRQTLEKWSNQRYATIPVLKRNGEYVGRVVYLSYSSRSSTVRRTMPMNTLRSSTTGTKFCSMAAFKSVGMSVVTVTAL